MPVIKGLNMQILKAVVGLSVHKRTEENFIRISVFAYLKLRIVLDGYILNTTMVMLRMAVPQIKESFRWNMNPMSLSSHMYDN